MCRKLAGMAQPAPAISADPVIEAHIQEWLKKMTLEEKIGQMCEITVDVVTDFPGSKDGFKLSEAMLDTVIGKYKVGSILNVPLSVAQKKEVWAAAIKQIQEKSMKEIGIPCIYGVDQIHGTTYTLDGTLFPQGVNMELLSIAAWFVVEQKYLLTKQRLAVFPGPMLRLSI